MLSSAPDRSSSPFNGVSRGTPVNMKSTWPYVIHGCNALHRDNLNSLKVTRLAIWQCMVTHVRLFHSMETRNLKYNT